MYIIQKGKVRVSKRFARQDARGLRAGEGRLLRRDGHRQPHPAHRHRDRDRRRGAARLRPGRPAEHDRPQCADRAQHHRQAVPKAPERAPQDPAPREERRAGADRAAPALPLPGAARRPGGGPVRKMPRRDLPQSRAPDGDRPRGARRDAGRGDSSESGRLSEPC